MKKIYAALLLLTLSVFAEKVEHPNLILNKAEIELIKKKIKTDTQAKALFADLKAKVEDPTKILAIRGMLHRPRRHSALCALYYAITGEKKYAVIAYNRIRSMFHQWRQVPKHYIWESGLEEAVIYDLIYDALTPEQRTEVETAMKQGARNLITFAEAKRQTWNMYFNMHSEVGVMGFATGDKELIEWGMNDAGGGSFEKYTPKVYGGYYQVMEATVKDNVWHEPNAYLYWHVLTRMVTLAEAATRYYKRDIWNWRSPTGNSLKGIFSATLDRMYPAEDHGTKNGSFRLTSYGHAGTQHHKVTGDWNLNSDFFIVNNPGDASGGMNYKFDVGSLFELAYYRTKDPEFAWIISQNPSRNWSTTSHPIGTIYGYAALLFGNKLDPKNTKKPKAPSTVFPEASFAMLRDDETESYWYGKGNTCFMMTGGYPNRSHSNMDSYAITFHSKGRLIYPDNDPLQYEDDKKYGWSQRSIAHNTLVIDGGNMFPTPWKHRKSFTDDVKIFSASGAPYQKKTQWGDSPVGISGYPKNVNLGRGLFLTKDYLADFFWAMSNKEHIYDWTLHGYGALSSAETGYEPTEDLAPYRWIKDVKKKDSAANWSVDWVQNFHKGQEAIGIRMTMLGDKGNTAYLGDGPLYRFDLQTFMKTKPKGPISRMPMVIARRKAKNVLFAALHEPYSLKEKGKVIKTPRIKSFTLIERTDTAVAAEIKGPGYTDYCAIRFTEDAKITQAVAVPGIKISEIDKGWVFSKDEKKTGEAQGWSKPTHDAKAWTPIKTNATWEAQGHGKYDGVGWYRTRFNVPAELKGKRIYLHFAGVDEDPKVFVNGKFSGERVGVKLWDKEWHCEITGQVKFGAVNDLIIKVLDRAYAGGIYKAVHLVHSLEKKVIKKEADKKIVRLKSKDGKVQLAFENFLYIRVHDKGVRVQGDASYIQIPASGTLTINNKKADRVLSKGLMIYERK